MQSVNRPKPKMSDVASRCGVSETTVSHVINGTKKVASATREKIEKAMLELGFHRDSHARRLARGHSDFLGIIVSDIENPFFPSVIKAFESKALELGYEVLLCTTNYEKSRMEYALRKMIENKSPGVAILTSSVDDDAVAVLESQGVRTVFLDSQKPGARRSSIRLNYDRGATESVRYLYDLGHRRFALVAGPQSRASHYNYRRAIENALKVFDLELQIVEGENNTTSGGQAATQFLREKQLPTAILCSNDLTAMGLIQTLEENGVHVPQDVSVIGSDDVPFATLFQPALSTVRVPREELGTKAVEILRAMIDDKSPATIGADIVIDTELVIRKSSASAKAN